MITTEEIAMVARKLLVNSAVAEMITGEIEIKSVGYARMDYSKEDVILVPQSILGEGSVRFGGVKVNIHVPDIALKSDNDKKPVYVTYFKRLIAIRAEVIKVLENHYEKGKGYNWNIGLISPPIKEPERNEHFVSLDLEITVRNKKFN